MAAVKRIVVLPGDHIGREVVEEAVKVLGAVEQSLSDVHFDFQYHLVGGAAIDATGSALPDEALGAAKEADAVLLGAVGGPKWQGGAVRPEQGLLKLRQELGVYANLRPCNFAADSLLESS